jgi:hypothetical protein
MYPKWSPVSTTDRPPDSIAKDSRSYVCRGRAREADLALWWPFVK